MVTLPAVSAPLKKAPTLNRIVLPVPELMIPLPVLCEKVESETLAFELLSTLKPSPAVVVLAPTPVRRPVAVTCELVIETIELSMT